MLLLDSSARERNKTFDSLQGTAIELLANPTVRQNLGGRALELAQSVEAAVLVNVRGNRVHIPRRHRQSNDPFVLVANGHRESPVDVSPVTKIHAQQLGWRVITPCMQSLECLGDREEGVVWGLLSTIYGGVPSPDLEGDSIRITPRIAGPII